VSATVLTGGMAMAKIWEVRVSDGTRHFFSDSGEAQFFYDDTAQCGFTVHISEISLPKTPKEFACFMQNYFAPFLSVAVATKKLERAA
jgi:hypothetical protein